MNRFLKCCLCSVLLLLLIPFTAMADNSDLEAIAVQLDSAESIDAQLALIGDAAELFAEGLDDTLWDISLSPAPASDLPEGLLPENYEDAEPVDVLPDDLKEGTILAFYDDEGSISLLGDFMARLSPERRAQSLDSADIILVVRHEDVARTDYIGSAYNRDYFGYIWRAGSTDLYRFFSQVNTPPVSGMGTLYGSSMSKRELWEKMRFNFFSSKVIEENDGSMTTYTLMPEGWVLSGLDGDRMVLEVPGEIDGRPVVAVSKSLSGPCPSVQRIVLAEGVKTIEDGVFRDLHSLTEVVLPESLVSIGANAFNGCHSLTELVIPDNVESIGANAFSNMESLASLKLPAAPVVFGEGVMTGFNRVGALALPEGLVSFPTGCFLDSYGLTAIYVPSSVVNFPDSFMDWIVICTPQGSPAQMWAETQGLTVCTCESAEDLPQVTVEKEDQYYYVIFDGQAILVNTDPEIQYVNVPDSFGGAPLTQIRHAFDNDDTAVYVSVPEGVFEIGDDFCSDSETLQQVVLPSTLLQMGDYAFEYCYGLESLTLPEGLSSVGTSMGRSCSALTSVVIPSALTELPEDFLNNASSLTSLVVPEGVRKIPAGMLSGCTGLFSLYLPESVVQIETTLPSQVTIYAPEGSPALMWAQSNGYDCIAMEDSSQMPVPVVNEEGDLVYILYDGEAYLKKYNGEAETLQIPETLGGAPVTRILEMALSSDYLTSVTVADSVRRLDYHAFYDNDYLESVYLPDTIEYMDADALRSIYHDCTIYTPEGSYAWDFVNQDLNCSGGHVFTLENWEHESVPVEKTETGADAGFFPDLDELLPQPEPLLTYGGYAGEEPNESGTMEDGRIFQQYTNVTKDEYGDYGSALGSAGYSILDTATEEGIVILTLGFGEEKFTMTYDPQSETMVFIFDADANIG